MGLQEVSQSFGTCLRVVSTLKVQAGLCLFTVYFVIYRLSTAGAVLLAKLVTGSLAYNDIWFGGRTRNPWNIEEYSYGSSAGPASSTSAGKLLLFSHLKVQENIKLST